MKIDIIIKDANKEEAASLLAFFSGSPSKETSTTVFNSSELKEKELVVADNGITCSVVEFPASNSEVTMSNDVDASGLPWDSRIHSSNKGKTAKGVWNRRRGVDDATVQIVENELRRLPAGTVGIVHLPVQSGYDTAPVQQFQPIQQFQQAQPVYEAAPQQFQQVQPIQQPVYEAAPQQVQQVQPIQQPVYEAAPQQFQQATPVQQVPELNFQIFMKILSGLFSSKQITPDYVNGLVSRINGRFSKTLMTITDIASSPEMINYAYSCIINDGKKVD